MPKYGVSLTKDIKSMADRLAEERGIGLSALISLLIFEKEGERVQTSSPGQPKPVGRPRHTAQDKQITRWIERAEKLSVYWKDQLESGKFVAMFGYLQDKLDQARESRDAFTLKILAEGNTWEEAVDAYYEREKEEGSGTT